MLIIRSFVHSRVQWEDFRRTLLDDKGRHATHFQNTRKKRNNDYIETLVPDNQQSTIFLHYSTFLGTISIRAIGFSYPGIYKGTFFKFGYEST
jgi:hypothetical protein